MPRSCFANFSDCTIRSANLLQDSIGCFFLCLIPLHEKRLSPSDVDVGTLSGTNSSGIPYLVNNLIKIFTLVVVVALYRGITSTNFEWVSTITRNRSLKWTCIVHMYSLPGPIRQLPRTQWSLRWVRLSDGAHHISLRSFLGVLDNIRSPENFSGQAFHFHRPKITFMQFLYDLFVYFFWYNDPCSLQQTVGFRKFISFRMKVMKFLCHIVFWPVILDRINYIGIEMDQFLMTWQSWLP